jgi:hypothetical protein
MLVIRIANNLPCLVEIGPANKAPKNPPTTYIEDIAANWASFIGIHWGNFESGWEAT